MGRSEGREGQCDRERAQRKRRTIPLGTNSRESGAAEARETALDLYAESLCDSAGWSSSKNRPACPARTLKWPLSICSAAGPN